MENDDLQATIESRVITLSENVHELAQTVHELTVEDSRKIIKKQEHKIMKTRENTLFAIDITSDVNNLSVGAKQAVRSISALVDEYESDEDFVVDDDAVGREKIGHNDGEVGVIVTSDDEDGAQEGGLDWTDATMLASGSGGTEMVEGSFRLLLPLTDLN